MVEEFQLSEKNWKEMRSLEVVSSEVKDISWGLVYIMRQGGSVDVDFGEGIVKAET